MHHVASQTGQGEQQEAVFAALVELRNAARLKAVLPQAVADERERLTAEFRRIQAITDLDERAAAVLRMEIIEEILTLKCPACRKAFHDFDGCFALTCSDASCGAGFCAWCLKHCGRDAHSHVAACPESRRAGEFYSSLEDFHDHHRRRKGRLIGERLRQEKPAVRGMTLRLLEPDLTMPDGKKIVVQ